MSKSGLPKLEQNEEEIKLLTYISGENEKRIFPNFVGGQLAS